MPRFDHVILTASNDAQARGYEAQIAWRDEQGALNPDTQFHVVADPEGRRIGSLGATVHALRELLKRMAAGGQSGHAGVRKLLRDQQILICHSGGDSRRLPAYAAQGKAFTPLPTTAASGIPAALFDLALSNYERLPARAGGGVLIVSGDVLLTFDPNAVDFDAPGVVGVAYPGPAERGARHGVFVTDAGSMVTGCSPVSDFLQKPDEPTAREHGAIDAVGRLLVDTGIFMLDLPTVERLLRVGGVNSSRGKVTTGKGLMRDLDRGNSPGLDLYEALAFALTPRMTWPRYRKAMGVEDDDDHAGRLRRLHDALHGVGFHVNVLPYCDFFHIGTSRELLSNVASLTRTAEQYGFTNLSGSVIKAGASLEGAFAYNTIVASSQVRASQATLMEAVHADRPVELPGMNILVGLPSRSKGRRALRLRENIGLVCVPVGKNEWAAIVFGVDDDFKGQRGTAAGCLFLNESIDAWLDRHDVSPNGLWASGAPQDLWQAKLWAVGTLDRVLDHAKWIQSARTQSKSVAAWRQTRRVNMDELLPRVNHDRLLAHRQEIRRRVTLEHLADRLLADDELPAAEVADELRDRDEAAAALDSIRTATERDPGALFRARAMKTAHVIAERHHPTPAALKRCGFSSVEAIEDAAFAAVAEAVGTGVTLDQAPRPADILHDQVVWATTPVRLDFSGGWSDTPPFCTERGGRVLNAAVTLNDQYPVQAMAKLNRDGMIRLTSIDLGRRVEIRRTEELLDHHDPTDWAALPKAAAVLAGIGPPSHRQSLGKWLDTLGGGLDLTIFSAVPKGSGLGTSSILGAAVLAALRAVRGEPIDNQRIIALISVLEQYMTTGGGWQDQVGGIVPGVKLIRTSPGLDQTPALQWTVFDRSPGSELRSRLLLYYTGLTRMAKNILKNVVGRYLARDPQALRAIDELKDAAEQMKADLDARDIDAFAAGIERYWGLKKTLDPGSTNDQIERLLGSVDKWTAGRCLAGAGGGGFVFFVAKDPAAAEKIRRTLQADPPSPQSRLFAFDVDNQGLRTTVL